MLAVLFTYVPSTGETMATPFEGGDNPISKAHGLKASCEDDFPGAIWAVAGDEEAIKAMADARMEAILGKAKKPDPR